MRVDRFGQERGPLGERPAGGGEVLPARMELTEPWPPRSLVGRDSLQVLGQGAVPRRPSSVLAQGEAGSGDPKAGPVADRGDSLVKPADCLVNPAKPGQGLGEGDPERGGSRVAACLGLEDSQAVLGATHGAREVGFRPGQARPILERGSSAPLLESPFKLGPVPLVRRQRRLFPPEVSWANCCRSSGPTAAILVRAWGFDRPAGRRPGLARASQARAPGACRAVALR